MSSASASFTLSVASDAHAQDEMSKEWHARSAGLKGKALKLLQEELALRYKDRGPKRRKFVNLSAGVCQ